MSRASEPGSRVPFVAGLLHAAEWHVRLAAVGAAVDGNHAGASAAQEHHGAVEVAGVDRRGQSVGGAIGEVERGGKIRHAIEAADGAEDFARRDFEILPHILD